VSGRRLPVRDYKRPRRESLSLAGAALRPFALGLLVGLAVAVAVYVNDHRAGGRGAVQAAAAASSGSSSMKGSAGKGAQETPGGPGSGSKGDATDKPAGASAGTQAAGSGAQSTGLAKYDFYQMLPRSQVLIPGRESDARPLPGGEVDRPGVYYLQIGSYRDAAVAERMRAQAQKLGITATVQLIVVSTTAWHRVRVGPIRDLTELNHVRRQLAAGNLEALVVRVNP